MGRIKTQLIKRLSFELLKEHKDDFQMDFEQNKKLVEAFLTKTSKKMRNVITGYVTRLMKRKDDF